MSPRTLWMVVLFLHAQGMKEALFYWYWKFLDFLLDNGPYGEGTSFGTLTPWFLEQSWQWRHWNASLWRGVSITLSLHCQTLSNSMIVVSMSATYMCISRDLPATKDGKLQLKYTKHHCPRTWGRWFRTSTLSRKDLQPYLRWTPRSPHTVVLSSAFTIPGIPQLRWFIPGPPPQPRRQI